MNCNIQHASDLAAPRVRRHFVLLFFVAFLIRTAVVILQGTHYIHTDTSSYWENAQSLAATGILKAIPIKWSVQIGFSWMLAPFIFFGAGLSFIGHILMPAIGASVAVTAGILASQMGNGKAGLFAGWCCALHPTLINYSAQIISEMPTALLLLLGVYYLVRSSLSGSLISGVCFGLACATRSPCLGVMAAIMLACLMLRLIPLKNLLIVGAVASAIIMICVLQLSIAYNRLIFLTPQTNQLNESAPVAGGMRWLDSSEIQERGYYLHFARTHTIDFLKERSISCINFISVWPCGDDRSTLKKAVIALSEGPFMLIGMMLLLGGAWRKTQRSLLLLPAAWMGLWFFHTMTYSLIRYRVPVLPLLIVFISVAWSHNLLCKPDSRTKRMSATI